MKNIFALLLIGASIGIIFGYIKPTWTQLGELRAEETKYNEAADKIASLSSTLDKQQAVVKGIPPADIERLDKLLPDSVDNVKLIIDISNIASSEGLAIKDINVATPKEEGTKLSATPSRAGYDYIDLSFSITAPYAQFLRFMTTLEQSLRLVDVIKVSFLPSNTGDAYTFAITIRTYWLK